MPKLEAIVTVDIPEPGLPCWGGSDNDEEAAGVCKQTIHTFIITPTVWKTQGSEQLPERFSEPQL